MKPSFSIFIVAGAALIFSLAGCGKNPQSSNAGNLKLSIRAISGSPGLPGAFGRTGLLKKGASAQAQQITITSAKVVVGEIEFETSLRDSMDFESETPLVVNLDLTGMPTPLGTVSVPMGTYEEMEVEIEKLDPEDGQVYLANPDLQNLSISVQGYVDGDPNAVFVFASAIEEEQEWEFSPPLVIDASSPQTNVVLSIDTRTWFSDGAGGYIDPRSGQNQKTIERNIKASIKVFEDEDDNGEDDDDDDDDD